MSNKKEIVKQLDLTGYIEQFEGFLARPKPLFMEGDRSLHFRFIKALENGEIF